MLHIVLLVIDERGGVVCAAIKQEGLEAEGDVVEELRVTLLLVSVEKQTETVENVVKQETQDYLHINY